MTGLIEASKSGVRCDRSSHVQKKNKVLEWGKLKRKRDGAICWKKVLKGGEIAGVPRTSPQLVIPGDVPTGSGFKGASKSRLTKEGKRNKGGEEGQKSRARRALKKVGERTWAGGQKYQVSMRWCNL